MYTWINIPKEKHIPWEGDAPGLVGHIQYPRFHLTLLTLAVLLSLCVLPFIKLFELASLIRGGGGSPHA